MSQIQAPAPTTSEQREVRLAKRARLIGESGDAYLVDINPTHTTAQVRSDAAFAALAPDERSGTIASIAGRLVSVRNGGKLCFAVLQGGDGEKLQLMISLAEVGEESIRNWKELVDLGDHIFATGEIMSSRTGELSLFVSSWQVASKALRPLPNLHNELNDETRVRQRYLDLLVRPTARNIVFNRARVNASLRSTLTGLGCLEVETPMLQTLHGGAAARPFATHSNAFDMELFLRIAPELFLKRAVVGGIEKVFEINRNFRNEGSDSSHSPEFAMLEAYVAYADYMEMAELTRTLIINAVQAIHGSLIATWEDGTEYDFSGDWNYISMYESLSEAIGESITPETPLARLQGLLTR